LTVSGKPLPDIISRYLLIHDLTTTSRNNIQHNVKIKVLITIRAADFND